MSKEKQQCAVNDDSSPFPGCELTATLECGGYMWCRIHHPPTIAREREQRIAKRDTRAEKRRFSRLRQVSALAAMEEIENALATGVSVMGSKLREIIAIIARWKEGK